MTGPAIKEPEEWTRTSCTLPKRVWARVDKNLDVVNSTRPHPERYSRDKLMAELLDWACREMERERAVLREAAGKKKAGGA